MPSFSDILQASSSQLRTCCDMQMHLHISLACEASAETRLVPSSRPDPSGLSRTYVDDRSFASARVWCLYDRIMQWASWSNDVGLHENNGKTAAVATSKRLRKELTQVLPRFAHTTVEILGCSLFLVGVGCF